MKKLLVLLIACLALTLAACGDDDDGGGGGSGGTDAPAKTTPADSATDGATAKVDIPAISFEPQSITVKSGTMITWTNSDDLPHTVTKTGGPGPEFDSGNLDPGSEFQQEIRGKGKIDYVCTIHPNQKGSITVE